MTHKLIFLQAAAAMLLSLSLGAQPQGGRPQPPKMKSPAELAKTEADKMQSEVGLDKKQYKKVYNLLKKDYQYRKEAAEQRFGGGMPQGGPGGMGGPGGPGMGGGGMMGGGPGMGGGGMMGGGPGMGSGGMMGGGPGMGSGGPMGGGSGMGGGSSKAGGQDKNPGGPDMNGGPGMGPGDDLVSEEYLEKQDAKLKKILTSDQYSKWRSKHPAEHKQLPPVELK